MQGKLFEDVAIIVISEEAVEFLKEKSKQIENEGYVIYYEETFEDLSDYEKVKLLAKYIHKREQTENYRQKLLSNWDK